MDKSEILLKLEVYDVRQAITADQAFLDRIKDSEVTGIVHSTFKRTVNIQFSNSRDLYTIACNEVDNGPNTLIIDLDRPFNESVDVNDDVIVVDNTLSISKKMRISFKDVIPWSSALPTYSTHSTIVIDNIYKIRQFIEQYGVSGGMKRSSSPTSLFEKETHKLLKYRSEQLMWHLQRNEQAEALKYAISLVGLGPGLTPSGDDFLVGLFTILNVKGSAGFSLRPFCDEVVNQVKPFTNEISYMALKKAATGEVRESIVHLVEALFNEDDNELMLALKEVLMIGSSSGTDITLGILAGLELNLIIGGK